MLKNLKTLATFLLFTSISFAQGKHPNLILTKDGVQQIKQGLGKYPLLDKTFAEAKSGVDADIKNGIDVPFPKDPGGGYSHEKHKLNYQNMLNAGIIWQVTGDKKYAEYVKAMFLAYAKMYPTLGVHPEGKNSGTPGVLFWQSLNDAVWLVHAAQAYDCVYDYLSKGDRKFIEDSLLRKFVQYMIVNDSKTFNMIHNHGTWSVAGVAMTGYVIGDTDMVNKAIYGGNKDGKTGYLKQIQQLFSPDGYYTEGAYYLRYAIQPFLVLAKAIDNNQPSLKIFSYKNGTLAKATSVLLQMTDADGYFLPFNDALKDKSWESGEVVYAVDISYGSVKEDPSLLYVAQKQDRVLLSTDGVKVAKALAAGKSTNSFKWHSVALTDGADGSKGGISILRSKETPDAISALLKYSAYGMDHGHFDKLAIQLYDGEKEILTDYGGTRFLNIEQKRGGRYLPENRTWSKQTIAHNTVTVDGKSNYENNTKKAEAANAYSYTHFNDLSNKAFQITSGKDTTAYNGVAMQRTLAMVQPEGIEKPFLIDVYRISSKEQHQYDYSFYYLGSLIETNIKYTASPQMYPFGKKDGYEYLWVKAKGTASTDNSLFTLFNEHNFYTIITTTSNNAEVFFTEIGANDPEFSLRNEPGITIRENGSDHVFASVIEPHGSFSATSEASKDSYGSFVKIEVLGSNDEATVVVLTNKKNEKWLLEINNGKASATDAHTVTFDGKSYSWTGNYSFKKAN